MAGQGASEVRASERQRPVEIVKIVEVVQVVKALLTFISFSCFRPFACPEPAEGCFRDDLFILSI